MRETWYTWYTVRTWQPHVTTLLALLLLLLINFAPMMRCATAVAVCALLLLASQDGASVLAKKSSRGAPAKSKEQAKAEAKAMNEKRKAEWKKDPKHCEVCMRVLGDLHTQVKALPKKQRKDKVKIEGMVDKYCSKKNKDIGNKERKLCYYLVPIKREISTPLAFGADAKAVCKKLERKSAEVCAIKYPIEGAGGDKQEKLDYSKMRVKHLKQILRERGVKIPRGWSDKRQFVKKCEETEHLAPEL